MEHLVFRLYGPMASWGRVAVGQARHSDDYPSKSAIVGLLGAALGVVRDDHGSHAGLTNCYAQAIKVLKAGRRLRDYHTTQVPSSRKNIRYFTRREEIVHGKADLNTVLSNREYLTDAHVVVAIRARPDAIYSLSALRDALLQPRYHLYLGRKSCPLAVPVDAQLLEVTDFRQALDSFVGKQLLITEPQGAGDARWLPDDSLIRYYWEGELQDFATNENGFDVKQVQKLYRYDKPLSKTRWQFESRFEYYWSHKQEY